MKLTLAVLTTVVFVFLCGPSENAGQTTPPPLPNPILYLIGQEQYSAKDGNFVRYRYGVMNSSAYPDAMFAGAPALPPCGANTKSSRTWVDLFDSKGKRLYGFCALTSSDKLNTIWFAMREGEVPPSWIYIELNDRQTGIKYKSNLAETTL